LGGVVTYSDKTKTSLIGVPEDLIKSEGAVSAAVARAMAEGIREKLATEFAIGITGVAGPDKDDKGNEVGTVYVALSAIDDTYVRTLHLGADRGRIRTAAANNGLDMLRRYLTGMKI
jgi:nicotinamide-nucleotide amidase